MSVTSNMRILLLAFRSRSIVADPRSKPTRRGSSMPISLPYRSPLPAARQRDRRISERRSAATEWCSEPRSRQPSTSRLSSGRWRDRLATRSPASTSAPRSRPAIRAAMQTTSPYDQCPPTHSNSGALQSRSDCTRSMCGIVLSASLKRYVSVAYDVMMRRRDKSCLCADR